MLIHRAFVGTFALGLLLACGDDGGDDGIDAAAPRDAFVPMDAPTADAPTADAPTGDAGGEFTATLALTPGQEVPTCGAAGAGATGSGTVTLDAAGTTIDVTNLTYLYLSGPVTGGHIHAGAPGAAGPIVFDLGPDLSSPIDRTFTAADYPSPPPSGAPPTFAMFVEAMRDGDTYVNLHTAACPSGEIRDQIE